MLVLECVMFIISLYYISTSFAFFLTGNILCFCMHFTYKVVLRSLLFCFPPNILISHTYTYMSIKSPILVLQLELVKK